MRNLILWLPMLLLAVCIPAGADDWPRWLGPRGDSVWRETGIVDSLPEKPKIKWRAPVELGYSGPAVADGRVFVTDYVRREGDITNNPGGVDKLEGDERVLCFDAASGKLLWSHEYERPYRMSYPGGPRCTPTVDGDRVYTLGAEGDLLCLNVADGKVLWQKQFTEEFEVKTPIWGFAAHPLVDGDALYCVVGGEGSVAVAFDKYNGKELWRALSAPEPGYCPPTMIEHAGVKQLLIWHPVSLNSLDPRTGEVYWTIPLKPSYSMSITAPRKQGDLLFAGGIGNVAALMQLSSDKPGAEIVWRGTAKTAIYPANSTPFLADGMIYGADCQTGKLIGARIEDGARVWETMLPTTGGERRASHGTAFIVRQADHYFLFSETGDLILANLSPEGYEELGRMHVLEPTNFTFGREVVWSHPAFAERCMFARNDNELVCVDLEK